MRAPKIALAAGAASGSLLVAKLACAADVAGVAGTSATASAAAPLATADVSVNWNAIVMFLIFVAMTLAITYWAAKRTKTATDFYAAGRGVTGLQNGLAIAGDYMSAASFLGIAALVYTHGF